MYDIIIIGAGTAGQAAYKEAINESNIILRISLDRKIIYANEAFFKISAYSKQDLIGKPYSLIKHYNLSEEEQKTKMDSIFSGKIWKGKISNLNKNEGIRLFSQE